MIKKLLSEIGLDVTLMLAGLFGSLIMVAKKTNQDLRATALGIISGTLSANYLTQIVVDLAGMEGKNKYGVAFLLGYLGLKGVETLIEKLTKKVNK